MSVNPPEHPLTAAPVATVAANGAGLSTAEARRRLEQYGPNAVRQPRRHPWRIFAAKFWAPVPWMLEATIILQLALGKWDEAIVIAALLVLNAALSFMQESRADRALALLKQRLSVTARALRDGRWQQLGAEALVPGDVIHVRMGDLVPADLRLADGDVLLDQSALTGESLPVEAAAGAVAYAGAVVRRGEATGEVTATGIRTFFGKTADLVRVAKSESHLARLILSIVKYLIALDAVLVLALFAYAIVTGLPLHDLLPFALVLLVASVPVALPATFTLATALGAQELARRGVLVTRLSAIEDAAAMDTLASDKTGTLTQNRLALAALRPHATYSADALLRLAALASDEATQDPIDLALIAAARARHLLEDAPTRSGFVPFDPHTKRSEALFASGAPRRAVKGAPPAVAALVPGASVEADVAALASDGWRVLAVAAGDGDRLELAGLVALEDPIRSDAPALIEHLHALGIRVVMVTGDGVATARSVASKLALGTRICPPQALAAPEGDPAAECDVFAHVLPEDKFRLVRALQRAGHVTGMTGDGVNDAPALKQAEVGVAVASATDVAKAAASLVLTSPGLGEVIAAVETSRRIYRRMLTYTLNKIVKTLEIAIFLGVGVIATGAFVITPLLMVLLLFTNDFVTMAIATDNAPASARPTRWNVRTLVLTAGALAGAVLLLSFTVLLVARNVLHLPLGELQTLVFLMLVFSGQGVVYLVREHGHFWASRPSRWLVAASVADIAAVSGLAIGGIFMTAIAPTLVIGLLAIVAAYLALVDLVKVRVFRTVGLG
jgi:H+-transporting ATPase